MTTSEFKVVSIRTTCISSGNSLKCTLQAVCRTPHVYDSFKLWMQYSSICTTCILSTPCPPEMHCAGYMWNRPEPVPDMNLIPPGLWVAQQPDVDANRPFNNPASQPGQPGHPGPGEDANYPDPALDCSLLQSRGE
jgi:hypothetical protein